MKEIDSARIGADVQFSRAALLNVADAVQNLLRPALQGSLNSRAGECVAVLIRIAQELNAVTYSDHDPRAAPGMAHHSNIVASERANLDAAERDFHSFAAKIAADRPGLKRVFDERKLERYLRSVEQGGSAVRVTHATPLAGGRSKHTILVGVEGAADLPSQFILRQDWASAVTGTSVISEYALLLHVWNAGLKVPKPLLLETGSDPLGAPFLLVTRMPGSGQGDIFNPPISEPLAMQVAEQLARLHTLPVLEFDKLGVPTHAYSQEQLTRGLAEFKSLHQKLGLPLQSVDIAIDWMQQNQHLVNGPRVLVHNDLGCHNFLIQGDELTAILDWELAHIGHPAADLGYIRGWIEKMTSWRRFMECYHACGGPQVDPVSLDFYMLWSGVRLYGLLLQARAGVASGAVSDTEITYACAHFMPQLVSRVVQHLQSVLLESERIDRA